MRIFLFGLYTIVFDRGHPKNVLPILLQIFLLIAVYCYDWINFLDYTFLFLFMLLPLLSAFIGSSFSFRFKDLFLIVLFIFLSLSNRSVFNFFSYFFYYFIRISTFQFKNSKYVSLTYTVQSSKKCITTIKNKGNIHWKKKLIIGSKEIHVYE